MKTQFYIFLLLLSLFTSCRSQLTQDFEACYPENKLQVMYSSTQYLDHLIVERFPAKSTMDSYHLFAEKWAKNANFISENFDKNELALLKQKLKTTLLLEELVYTYDTGKIGYYQCLRQLDDAKINVYLSSLDDVERNMNIPFIIAGFTSKEISTYDDLHFFILKLELIVQLTNFYNQA